MDELGEVWFQVYQKLPLSPNTHLFPLDLPEGLILLAIMLLFK